MKHFILDETADLKNVKINDELAVGSTIFVIATSEHYMLNSSKKWIKVNLGSGGNSGGDTPGEDDEPSVEYDGGDVL